MFSIFVLNNIAGTGSCHFSVSSVSFFFSLFVSLEYSLASSSPHGKESCHIVDPGVNGIA